MLLLSLPHELLLSIWDVIETETDKFTLVRTCHYLYNDLSPRFYRHLVHESDLSRRRAMNWASQQPSEIPMQKLLAAGANKSHQNEAYPLCTAARHARLGVIKLLLRHGFDANESEPDEYELWDNESPLRLAAVHDRPDIIQALLEAGADIEDASTHDRKSGQTALSRALYHCNTKAVAVLLKWGASTDILVDEDRSTPMQWAARFGESEIVSLLLKRNVQINDGASAVPLALAARLCQQEMVAQLIDAGADVEALNDFGGNALHEAAAAGHEAITALLLSKGASVDPYDFEQYTALSWSVIMNSSNLRVTKLLLDSGSDIEHPDLYGRTPLALAAKRGYEAGVKFLLDNGADPAAVDITGLTPLAHAVRWGHSRTVLAMLDHESSSEAKTGDPSASAEKTQGCARFIDIPDNRIRTPLFLATQYGHEDSVRLLLSRGASLDRETCAGRTALSFATEMKQLVLESGDDTIQRIWELLSCPSKVTVDMHSVEKSSKKTWKDEYVRMECNCCLQGVSMYDTILHCATCSDGDFDIDLECLYAGQSCLVNEHTLEKRREVNGEYVSVSDEPFHQPLVDLSIRKVVYPPLFDDA